MLGLSIGPDTIYYFELELTFFLSFFFFSSRGLEVDGECDQKPHQI